MESRLYRIGIRAGPATAAAGRFNPAHFSPSRSCWVHGTCGAVRAIRAQAKKRAPRSDWPRDTRRSACPLSKRQRILSAAARAARELNAPTLTVIQEGEHAEASLAAAGSDAPKRSRPEDLKIISSRVVTLPASKASSAPTCGEFRADSSPIGFWQ